MNLYTRFTELGEPVAAALYEEPSRSEFYRISLALRRYYENVPLPEYRGGPLYPSGNLPTIGRVVPNYMSGISINLRAIAEKDADAAEELKKLELYKFHSTVPWEHTVAGNMWIHSMPNYERIAGEGFDSYFARIERIIDRDTREGLVQLLSGIKAYHNRILEYLRSVNAEPELISVLEQVPFKPARNVYEAIAAWNYAMYLDGCDNLGALAGGLIPYFRGEDITSLLKALFTNLDANNGYSMQLCFGGDEREYPIAIQCLKAAHAMRRPMIELFVDDSTPAEVWNAALECVRSGSGSPSFYNRTEFRRGFTERFPQIRKTDLARLCGGGCTEMMIPGYSNVGSLDAGINLPYILVDCIENKLADSASFDEFYQSCLDEIASVVANVTERISETQRSRAAYIHAPMRTLLIDDCIDRGLDYNAGGARYMWSVINFAGIVNAIDSLLVIRDLVFRDAKYSPEELIGLLKASDEAFLAEAKVHETRYGIDNDEANALSRDFTAKVFAMLADKKPALGFGFIPSSIQFQDYARAGSYVGATPDGRAAGAPLADSLTAILGKDTAGPTALLKSVASLDLKSAIGTPVFNFTVNPQIGNEILKSLIESYMKLGGMQMQITCVSRELMELAMKEPANCPNFVVRVGGYSEYFKRLSDTLKQKVIERTLY